MLIKIFNEYGMGYYCESDIDSSDIGKKCYVSHPVYGRITGYYTWGTRAYQVDKVIDNLLHDNVTYWEEGGGI